MVSDGYRRGYVSFAHFLLYFRMFVCVFTFFLSKISQELLDLGFLKFCTNFGYDKLYCVTKNQPHIAYQFLYLSIFSSPEPKAHR